jgi:signal transduction histidine kinase
MLSDVDRLNSLISNLLMVAKLEHRRRETHRQVIDFSTLSLSSWNANGASFLKEET